MDRRDALTATVVAAVAAVTPPTALAQEASDQGIVGSWLGTVTATNPPLGQFNDLISFHTGGVVTESRRYFVTPTPIGNLLRDHRPRRLAPDGRPHVRGVFRLHPSRTPTAGPLSARTTSASS